MMNIGSRKEHSTLLGDGSTSRTGVVQWGALKCPHVKLYVKTFLCLAILRVKIRYFYTTIKNFDIHKIKFL